VRLAAAALLTLLSVRAAAECTPADPDAIAAAERKARDAAAAADQAESVAVRSGNPGAHARAVHARDVANDAQAELDRLRCKEGDAGGPEPRAPGRGRYGQ
jgi:hypothetical protein